MQSSNEFQDNYSELYPNEISDDKGRILKARKVMKIVSEFVNLNQADVLEIGCFTGAFQEVFSNNCKMFIAIDIDEKAIKRARQRITSRNVKFYLKNIEGTDFNDSNFDLIICNHIYEHTPNISKMVREMHRILKPGGIIYFAAGNRWQLIEPHHRLPFLSWFPKPISNFYLSLIKKRRQIYYEKHLSYAGLLKNLKIFNIFDFTPIIVNDPNKYYVSSKPINKLQRKLLWFAHKCFHFFFPTFIFILRKQL